MEVTETLFHSSDFPLACERFSSKSKDNFLTRLQYDPPALAQTVSGTKPATVRCTVRQEILCLHDKSILILIFIYLSLIYLLFIIY